jgi:hypothetical protein
MKPLANPSHEAFARALASGDTQMEAYDATYYKPHSSNASRLANRPEIKARVAVLMAPDPIPAVNHLVEIIRDLEGIRIEAMMAEPPQLWAGLRAIRAQCRLLGFMELSCSLQ